MQVKIIECQQQGTLSMDGLSDLLSSRFFIHKHDLFAVDEDGKRAIWLQNYYLMFCIKNNKKNLLKHFQNVC